MRKVVLIIILLASSIILFIAGSIMLNREKVDDMNCSFNYNKKEGEECGVQIDSNCYKGIIKNNKCVRSNSTITNILLILSFIMLFATITCTLFLKTKEF